MAVTPQEAYNSAQAVPPEIVEKLETLLDNILRAEYNGGPLFIEWGRIEKGIGMTLRDKHIAALRAVYTAWNIRTDHDQREGNFLVFSSRGADAKKVRDHYNK